MQRFHNILCVSDGTDADTEALVQALSQARNHGARVSLLITCPPLPQDLQTYTSAYEDGLKQQLQQRLQTVQARLPDAPALARVSVVGTEAPARTIVETVLAEHFDLVIKSAAAQRPAAAQLVEGSQRKGPHKKDSHKKSVSKGFAAVDMELLRLCPCPVWLSRPIVRERQAMVVAVAMEANIEDQVRRQLGVQLLQLGRALADQCSGELQVIACWDYPFEDYLRFSAWSRLTDAEVQAVVREVQAEQQSNLAQLIQLAGVTGSIKQHLLRGAAAQSIPEGVVQHSVDLLVMGTQARTGIPGLTMGNTAENILHQLSCSLMAVKPAGFESPLGRKK